MYMYMYIYIYIHIYIHGMTQIWWFPIFVRNLGSSEKTSNIFGGGVRVTLGKSSR